MRMTKVEFDQWTLLSTWEFSGLTVIMFGISVLFSTGAYTAYDMIKSSDKKKQETGIPAFIVCSLLTIGSFCFSARCLLMAIACQQWPLALLSYYKITLE